MISPDFYTIRKFFLSLTILLIVIGVLFWSNYAIAIENSVQITLVQTAAESSRDDLFILTNTTDAAIDLSGWSMRRCNASGNDGADCTDKSGTTSIVTSDLNDVTIEPSETFTWENTSSSGKLSDNYSIALFDDGDVIITALTWGDPPFVFENTPSVSNPTDCEVIAWNSTEELYEILPQERDVCQPIIYNGEILHLSELLPDPSDDEKEFIEIFNPNDEDIDLRGWSVQDSSASGIYTFENEIVEAGDYLIIDDDDFSFALNNSGTETISLFSPNEDLLDTVSYTSAREGFAYAKTDFISHVWEWTPVATPGIVNAFLSDTDYPDLIISEILPNPTESEEFIEIFNPNDVDVSLEFWMLSDSSDSPYSFASSDVVKSGGYFVVTKEDFKFALNNSGGETVTLTKPSGVVASVIEYTSAAKDVSYGWSGKKYRWSNVETPGVSNIFPRELEIKDVDVSKAYKDVYTTFDVETNYDDDQISVTWDFGDDSRSFKKETRHRYEEKETFDASVTVKNDIEEVTEEFTVKVKSYPKADVIMVALMPNPSGTDTDKEFIRLTNVGDKKVSLESWSIATGKDLNSLSNHPLKTKVSLPAGGSLDVTTTLSAISLNNAAGAVELRRPDGNVADAVRYDYFLGGESKSIPEDAVYELAETTWSWKLTDREITEVGAQNIKNDLILQHALANAKNRDSQPASDRKIDRKPFHHNIIRLFNIALTKIHLFLMK